MITPIISVKSSFNIVVDVLVNTFLTLLIVLVINKSISCSLNSLLFASLTVSINSFNNIAFGEKVEKNDYEKRMHNTEINIQKIRSDNK